MKNQLKNIFLIFKISAHDNKIVLLNVNKNFKTIAQTTNGTILEKGSLEKIFHIAGSEFLKNTIENTIDIKIDRIIKISSDELIDIINFLGGLKLNNKNIIEKKEKIQELIFLDPIKVFLNLKENFNNRTNLSNFFAFLSNAASTDITINDFESRKKGFELMIEKNNATILTPKIFFETFENRDKITKESKKQIIEAFK